VNAPTAPDRLTPDLAGPAAPPRRNGELVFDAPWEARAFGLALALLQQRGLGWDAFRPHLVAAVAARPDAPYYERLVAALEAFVPSMAGTGPGTRPQAGW
jgi:Nitrile hydratase beta subunit